MKKASICIVSIFTAIFIVFLCGCSGKTLSDNLFDEEVLNYFYMPWLQRPENAENETSVNRLDGETNSKTNVLYYSCKAENVETLHKFAELIFKNLSDGEYTKGYYVGYFQPGWFLDFTRSPSVKESVILENHYIEITNELYNEIFYRYNFYFINKTIWSNNKRDSKVVKDVTSIKIQFRKLLEEDETAANNNLSVVVQKEKKVLFNA